MPLTVGTCVGPYEVIAMLGAGGMGEVYRARDNKLNRDVALKVLPERFATDPERLARLRREAQVLASLNHPNIAAIHGFEDSSEVQALALELVEGPTLADRISQFSAGPPRVVIKGPNEYLAPQYGRPYDVSPDGRRLLMIQNARTTEGRTAEKPPLVVIQNWTEELRRLAPANPKLTMN
jgi:hypothetical protein